jgi:hypothetical protein
VILFERSPADGELRRASSSVELEFPRSKSWVRVDWRVEDPEGAVVGLEAEVALALGEGPALADFGAGSFVYAALAKDQVGALEAGTPAGEEVDGRAPAWKVLRGAPGRLEPYAIGPPPGKGPAPEGWAHLMDARRCTALAVAFFAREAADRIEADAAGRLRIARAFAAPGKSPRPGLRRLVFWLHFVDFPPQVGAVTSPQSMQSPLETSWER